MAEAKHIRTSIAQEGLSCDNAAVSPEDATTPIARLYRVLAPMRRMLNLGEFSDEDFSTSHGIVWELTDILCEMPTQLPMDLIFQLMARCDGGDPELLNEEDDILAECRRLAENTAGLVPPDLPMPVSPLRALHGEWIELIAKGKGGELRPDRRHRRRGRADRAGNGRGIRPQDPDRGRGERHGCQHIPDGAARSGSADRSGARSDPAAAFGLTRSVGITGSQWHVGRCVSFSN
ncbi:hypothetical protein [Pseudogemmobacter bohemicus]|uniref:hypothetical protein n=1 Tax=Pseudogemmobacter bohemicus TaxID=2250708 RepID=UPI0013009CD0|nr:hypothetical protein [Pseudogemmobacter bohemicus]